jgi:hypothetical protein
MVRSTTSTRLVAAPKSHWWKPPNEVTEMRSLSSIAAADRPSTGSRRSVPASRPRRTSSPRRFSGHGRPLPAHRDTGAPFAAWLYGIARHVAVDELRRSARAETRDEVPDRSVETGAFDRLALGEAIEQLPEEQRLVIELKYFAGLTNAEVASVIGGTPGAVNAKQWRALGAMRTFLADEEDV